METTGTSQQKTGQNVSLVEDLKIKARKFLSGNKGTKFYVPSRREAMSLLDTVQTGTGTVKINSAVKQDNGVIQVQALIDNDIPIFFGGENLEHPALKTILTSSGE
jgi:hypothetical protein